MYDAVSGGLSRAAGSEELEVQAGTQPDPEQQVRARSPQHLCGVLGVALVAPPSSLPVWQPVWRQA